MSVPRIKAVRQEAQVVTQTAALPSATYTTHITLGVPSATATDRPVVTSQHSGDGLSSAQIGAIVGAVVGTFILAFVVVCCCCRPRRPAKKRRGYRSGYGSDVSDGWSEAWPNENWTRPIPVPVSRPTPVQYPRPVVQREQVPGGPKFPTYKAIPIANPRRPENPPRTYW
ncbi:hypothetical protein F66182_6663 [Fusarium sp. NRRL 66182]|nr:hypothetical protein F66182_6663 [Fusarium sp. NRRL 66182]